MLPKASKTAQPHLTLPVGFILVQRWYGSGGSGHGCLNVFVRGDLDISKVKFMVSYLSKPELQGVLQVYTEYV